VPLLRPGRYLRETIPAKRGRAGQEPVRLPGGHPALPGRHASRPATNRAGPFTSFVPALERGDADPARRPVGHQGRVLFLPTSRPKESA